MPESPESKPDGPANPSRDEFLRYASEHGDLSAVWSWTYPGAVIAAAVATAVEEQIEPGAVLARMYRHPDISARPPVPKGHWTLEGGSPASQDLFRVVAGRAASALSNPSDQEPWRLWLDTIGAKGYACENPARAKSGQILGRYPVGFEDKCIEHVFRASADFRFVRSVEEDGAPPTTQAIVAPSPVADVIPEPGTNDATGSAVRKKRGRPVTIAVSQKEAALAARARGESWREASKHLYATKYPTKDQVKNASNILKNYNLTRVPPH